MLALVLDASGPPRLPRLAYVNVSLSTFFIVIDNIYNNLQLHRAVLPAIARLSCTQMNVVLIYPAKPSYPAEFESSVLV